MLRSPQHTASPAHLPYPPRFMHREMVFLCPSGNPLQAALKKEAAQSAVEEQLKEREAVEAENAANLAKVAENSAAVRAFPLPNLLAFTHTLHKQNQCLAYDA